MFYLFIIILLINKNVFINAFNQLSLSGGGSYGAVQIGILKKVIETDYKKYDLYTGISTGALNAGILSYYSDINIGTDKLIKIYSELKNNMIYKLFPITGISLLNMDPLHLTLSNIIKNIPTEPVINTLIGTTNLYTGIVEIYNFEKQTDENKVLLLMASSSIPVVFAPIKFNNNLYVDGGLLTNELINILPSNNYINITFITPYDDSHNYDKPIISFNDILHRTINLLASNFNTKLLYLNQNCDKPSGEINKYYVSSKILENYNILNFNDGEKLIELGYNNVMHKRYIIC